MLDRWALAPAPVVARADAGNRRLHRRWVQLEARKKKHTVITTAIAREIAGWVGPWPSWTGRPKSRSPPAGRTREEPIRP